MRSPGQTEKRKEKRQPPFYKKEKRNDTLCQNRSLPRALRRNIGWFLDYSRYEYFCRDNADVKPQTRRPWPPEEKGKREGIVFTLDRGLGDSTPKEDGYQNCQRLEQWDLSVQRFEEKHSRRKV